MLQPELKKVIENIIVNENTTPTIAVSGGIDSVTLAVYISFIFKDKKVKVSHAVGPAVPIEATNRVKSLSKKYNWELKIINTNEISDPRYAANPINRCFFCKENLYKTIKNYTSKTQLILFLIILTIFVFFWNLKEDGDVAFAIGFAIGYVYLFTIPCTFLAVFIMNKFKNNKKEFWNSWFFSLIPIFIILISQSIFGN